jgi:hypothetical protein
MNLLPESLYPALSKFERWTSPLWRRIAALRVLLVLEKKQLEAYAEYANVKAR